MPLSEYSQSPRNGWWSSQGGPALLALGAGLSQVALALILMSGRSFAGLSRRLFALLMLGVGGYLLLPLDTPLGWLFSALSTAVPGLFWLFCASLFDDHYEFPQWQPALVLASVALPMAFGLGGFPAGGVAEMLLRGVLGWNGHPGAVPGKTNMKFPALLGRRNVEGVHIDFRVPLNGKPIWDRRGFFASGGITVVDLD